MLRSTESDGDPPIVECVGGKPHDLHRGGVRFARCRDCLVEQGERTPADVALSPTGVLTLEFTRVTAPRLGLMDSPSSQRRQEAAVHRTIAVCLIALTACAVAVPTAARNTNGR